MSSGDVFGVLDEDTRSLLAPQDHPREIDPMLAHLEHEPFDDPDWIYERKLDGVRLVLHRDGGKVRLRTRNHEPREGAFPEIAEALAGLDVDDVVLDGEVVAFDGPRTSFSRLQGRMGLTDPEAALATGIAVYCYVFDVLHLAGHDVSALALRDRKRLLKSAIAFEDPLRFTPHRNAKGLALLDDACRRGWEGLLAKDATSSYVFGRSRSWRKFKCENRQEFVVGGFTEPKGERIGLGALLVGYHEDGALRFAGKVGTGYDNETLRALRDRLDGIERDESPFTDQRGGGDTHYVEPRIVAEVAFSEWTHLGRLRHPRYLGLRDDKDPDTVVREG